jgi:hypothetical protein
VMLTGLAGGQSHLTASLARVTSIRDERGVAAGRRLTDRAAISNGDHFLASEMKPVLARGHLVSRLASLVSRLR